METVEIEIEKETQHNNDEVIEYVQNLYEDKIEKILDINKKYEIDIHKLEDLVDLKDPKNVNNIIYKAVLDDKENELKDANEEFLKVKLEGINKLRRKSDIKK